MIKIGVIVTVFNLEQFVEQCLNSILQQTYGKIEVVVIDDGSTDSSGEICDKIAAGDCRVTVVHQQNQGTTAARLHGVKIISADYVTFVDGDDWIDQSVYEDIVTSGILENVDMVSYGIIRYYASHEMYREPCIFEEGIYHCKDIENRIIPQLFWNIKDNTYGLDPSLCTKIFRKELLEKYLRQLGTLKIHYGEDIAVFYPLFLECSSVAVLNQCYYYHRIRKNNMVAPYIKDDMYYGKLYGLYKYLSESFLESRYSQDLIRQLDYFYMYSVRLRKLKYQDLRFEERYLFPFDRIPKGSRIILYGAGQVGQTFYSQLEKLEYCEIVGWVDKDFSIYDSEMVRGIDEIKGMEYDYILIAIRAADICLKAQESLVRMGVEPFKIVRYQ